VNKLSERIDICEKAGLYRSMMKLHKGRKPEWLPLTFVLPDDIHLAASEAKRQDRYWILKPNGKNRGNGIEILSSSELKAKLKTSKIGKSVMQPYFSKPMLLDGRKFDMRMYLLVSTRAPFRAYFAPGYVRRSVRAYSEPKSGMDLSVHLTNQSVQKAQCPEYSNDENIKDESVWSLDQLSRAGNTTPWSLVTTIQKIQEIAKACASAIRNSLQSVSQWREF
jgi:hypothetical protein